MDIPKIYRDNVHSISRVKTLQTPGANFTTDATKIKEGVI